MRIGQWTALVVGIAGILGGCAAHHGGSGSTPPQAPREFRALWVATVANIDWPSKPGLSVAQQQQEMLAILDRARALRFNAIILQVRPSADAMYASSLEPWSEYLTGIQGKPPEPFYDPLQAWIQAAHERGLELHAWLNPYRARHHRAKSPDAPNHIHRTQPDVVRKYGDYLWLDPGEPRAAEHTLAVFADVLRRYDIDGIHIDDYFYPYPVANLDFPDEPAWRRYRAAGGTLSRGDWRRQNVNQMVQRIHALVRQTKPHVKFGISPFGIWKSGVPQGITGLDQYEKLYADARLWLSQGWLDYCSPQLYWRIEQTQQAFPVLLDWWIAQNAQRRHLWPGLYTSRIADGEQNWPAGEIIRQIELTRQRAGSTGHVHFSARAIMENRDGIADALARAYATPALVPASPWLDATPPGAPTVQLMRASANSVYATWSPAPGKPVRWWTVWLGSGGRWELRIYPAHVRNAQFTASTGTIDQVVISLSLIHI
jgi:uncharacterized lipoprotein YddW (UPF0748 family)